MSDTSTARNFLTIHLNEDEEVIKGLTSPMRLDILRLLRRAGPLNVNDIARALSLPQSTVATNIQILERAHLITTRSVKATRGHQKVCAARYDEILLRFVDDE